jgi:TonB family protein
MNARTAEYHPTLIDHGFLAQRLATELQFFKVELERWLIEFERNPVDCLAGTARTLKRQLARLLNSPHALTALMTAIVVVASIVATVAVFEQRRPVVAPDRSELVEVVTFDFGKTSELPSKHDASIGIDGKGRVGFLKDKSEGSGAVKQRSGGGGSGGNHEQAPPQVGKLPPPSPVLASIPKTPPLNPPSLPAAGIDIDPALWKDLKAPVYGDPRSTSEVPSKGPGEGEGIGTNRGLGIGTGDGPGYGPGTKGNTGGNERRIGCCGPGSGEPGDGGEPNRVWRVSEVEQKARLLSKPEPHYTEEARRQQVTGTVLLRVVFSSLGQVVQIRAVQSLPFGLTDKAIAAAREIKFVPATRGGHPVSVQMQLEYNFNLY